MVYKIRAIFILEVIYFHFKSKGGGQGLGRNARRAAVEESRGDRCFV